MMQVITNVECSENSVCLDFSYEHQLIFVEYKANLYLINSKNLPICSIPNGRNNLKKIIYDSLAKTVITLGDSIFVNGISIE